MTRIVGPTGSRRRRWIFLCFLVAALGTSAFFLSGAAAVPGGGNVFELDASLDQSNGSAPKAAITDNSGTGLPDDWDRVCHKVTGGAQCASAADDHALVRAFDSETTATGTANAQTIFQTGGSKDPPPLSNWQWEDNGGGVPGKDKPRHRVAARHP